MSNNAIWVWVIIIAVLVIGGVWWWSTMQPAMQTPTTTTGINGSADQGNLGGSNTGTPEQPGGTSVDVGGSVSAGTQKTVTVTFNGDAFDPKTVTINKGDTVKWVSTGGDMWVASAPHPTHEGYSGTTRTQHCPDTAGTAFDQCAPGTSYSMTFQKTGSWAYHDHLNSNLGGTVIVQ